MRGLITFAVFASFLISACHSTRSEVESKRADDSKSSVEIQKSEDSTTGSSMDTIRIENDELEYEIIILELGFNNWLASQPPMTYFSLNVLENRNRAYVFEWNQRAANPRAYNPNLYNQFIDYDPTIRYGLEVNYMLYMYFKFFQQKYNQRL